MVAKPNTSGSVYKREGDACQEAWNQVIREINELCENPDPGCDPLPTLEEVEEKHIWKVKDIQDVRDKLVEICEENDFEAELLYWKKEILDEIEEAINRGWCGCIECDACVVAEVTLQIGSYTQTVVTASPHIDRCCNIVEGYGLCYSLPPPGWEKQYMGDYAGCEHMAGNDALYEQVDQTYNNAYAARGLYVSAANKCCELACKLRRDQPRLDEKVAEIDDIIAEYLAAGCQGSNPPPQCSEICSRMQDAGYNARVKQQKLDEYVTEFALKHDEMQAQETLCNTSAVQNMAAAMSISPGRFPGIDVNHAIGALTTLYAQQYAMSKWFNPFCDNQIARMWSLPYSSDPHCATWAEDKPSCRYRSGCLNADDDKDKDQHTGCGIRPYAAIFYHDNYTGSTAVLGIVHFSPDGTPFISEKSTQHMQKLYAQPLYYRRFRTRCCLHTVGCPPEQGNPGCGCIPLGNWCPWGEPYEWWWGPSNCPTGWIYEPCLPPFRHVTYDVYVEAKYNGSKIGKDFTEEQQIWFSRYTDWYATHPKYDDRDMDYCP